MASSRSTTPLVPVGRAEIDHGFAELVRDPKRPRAWTLLIDGTPQSHVDLDDPEHLEFEYVRRIGHVVDLAAPPTTPLRVLHLGGGAWTLPRYVAATRPGSTQRVVELDAALIELVAARLPIDDRVEIIVGDARAQLARQPDSWAQLMLLDVFAGARTPAHLTSREFLADVRRVLAPDGVYVANVADGGVLEFARRQVATAATMFAETAVLAAPDLLAGRRFGNLVLACSDASLPVAGLTRRAAGDPFRATVLDSDELRAFAGGAAVCHDRGSSPSPIPPPGFFGR